MLKSYIKDNLIIDLDANDINTNDLSIVSKRKWNKTKVNTNVLNDYGLNQYDIGLSTDLKHNKIINNEYLKLERIGKPGINNTVEYFNYDLKIMNIPSIGNYIRSNGGYLLNPFKYHNYDIEYLPRQYEDGFTFETTLFVDNDTFKGINNNSNIFLFLGTRSEDKFADSYSGNSKYVTSEGATLNTSYKLFDISEYKENTQNIENVTTTLITKKINIRNNGQTDFIVDDIVLDEFTLVYNNNILNLNIDYTFEQRTKKIVLINIETNINDELYVNYYSITDEVKPVNININEIDNVSIDKQFNVNNNVIAFKFDKFGRIGYRKIDQNRNIEENYSQEQAVYRGWNHVVITFKPNTQPDIKDVPDDCKITPRVGNLSIYVNGLMCYSNDKFIEPIYNGFPIDRSKQIGVPYNISWGGGSVGLKHAYNFNGNDFNPPYTLDENNLNLIIQKNFDGHFKGGFQKLRIYNKPFDKSDVKINYQYESDFYKIKYNKGGRIIYFNDFVPQIDLLEDYIIYWTVLNTDVNYLDIDLNSMNKILLTSDDNITINNIDAVSKYILIVTTSSISNKTKWFIDILNNGDIGGTSNLFGDIVIENGFKYYITNYPTSLNSITLKKE
jgi:hypothetical protein